MSECQFKIFIYIFQYIDFSERKRQINKRPNCDLRKPRDIVQILADIKAQAVRKRVRIEEFMSGFDSMRHQKITCSEFKRALNSANIILNEQEFNNICEVFGNIACSGYVDYKRFCDTIEEAFSQKQLEREPLLVPLQHYPSEDDPYNFLNFDERCVVSLLLQTLSKYTDRFSNLSSVFEDFDKTKCGTITKHQLMKAFTLREIHTLISTRQFETLFKCFSKERGYQREFKYREFLKALDYVANAKIRLPY